MREMRPLFTVSPVQSGRNMFLCEGAVYVYRSKSLEPFGTLHKGRDAAQLQADKMTSGTIEQAEDENARIDLARRYIAMRKARPASAQLEMFA